MEIHQEHIRLIRQRLLAAKKRYEETNNCKTITPYEIHAKLTAQGKHCPTIPTVAKLLDPEECASSALIDITLVAELCKWFGCSLSHVLALPEDESVDPQEVSYGPAFSEFEDPGYFGELHGYMLRRIFESEKNVKNAKNDTERRNDTLVHCVIDLQKGEMRIYHDALRTIEEQKPTCFSGKVIRSDRTGNAWADFISDHGTFYHIMFHHRIFQNEPMYYREAAVLTTAAEGDQLPILSKMVLFRKEVSPEYFDYVRGLVSLDVKNVIISKDQFDRLAAQDEEISRFGEEFAAHLRLYERPFYVFPEQIIDMNQQAQMSPYDMKRVILKLRNYSYSPAQIVVGKDSKASTVAKEIQNYRAEPEE